MKNLTLQYWRLGVTNIQIRNPSLAQRHKNRVSLFGTRGPGQFFSESDCTRAIHNSLINLLRPDSDEHFASCLEAIRTLKLSELLFDLAPSSFAICVA